MEVYNVFTITFRFSSVAFVSGEVNQQIFRSDKWSKSLEAFSAQYIWTASVEKQRMAGREMSMGEEGGRGAGVVSSVQLGPAVLNGQQPGWWITPALSWVNGHRHPSPFNNVSACIVIEMSPKMEVNMQLSHLIWEAEFLPQAVDVRDPCKEIFSKQVWYRFRWNVYKDQYHQRARSWAGKQDNPVVHRFSQD